MASLRMLKRSEVLDMYGFSGSTLDRRIALGLITPPINLGGRRIGFIEYEQVDILQKMISGCTATDLKYLVHCLMERRQNPTQRDEEMEE